MDIYSIRAISQKMKHEPGVYDRITRFFRGDREALKIPQLRELRKVLEREHKNTLAAIDNQINKVD